MVSLADLWLPILAAAAFVFVLSSVIHMATPWHKGDMKKLLNEDKVLEALRQHGVPPGDYMFPCPGSMKEMQTPEMLERYRKGPVGSMTVIPNAPPPIGRCLVQWFLLSVVISLFTAYLATVALTRLHEAMTVFRVTAVAATLGYAFGHVDFSIWKGQSWTIAFKFFVDGLLYGLATGAAFAWLWPEGP